MLLRASQKLLIPYKNFQKQRKILRKLHQQKQDQLPAIFNPDAQCLLNYNFYKIEIEESSMENMVRSEILVKCQEKSQIALDSPKNQISAIREQIFEGSDQEKHHQFKENIKTSKSLNQKADENQVDSSENKKTKQVRSVFHNFQKHLVITLRQSIKIKKLGLKKQPQSVAWQLWENFVKQTKVYTKNILHIIFGVVDYQSSDLTNIYDEQIIQKFGYSEIFSQYSDSTITEAQQYIRAEVVRQLSQANLIQLMKKRRLSSTDGFIQYIKQFLSQLEQGPMRKRLPKTKKEEMGMSMKMSDG